MIVRTPRDFGAVVRDARMRKGWTQAVLAEHIGASRQWVVALEGGKPTAELGSALRALAALDVVADVVAAPPDTGIDLDALLKR